MPYKEFITINTINRFISGCAHPERGIESVILSNYEKHLQNAAMA